MGDTTERFPDLPILDELGDALMAAYLREKRTGRRRRRWPALSVARPRSPGRALVVAGLLGLLVAASSAAATPFVLRGRPIPAPSPRDVPPQQTPGPAGGVRRDVPVSPGGVFVTALRGSPEDLGIRVALSFADGHVERHPFGVSDSVVPDPTGGRAWRVEAFQFGRAIPARCARPGRHH